MVEKINDGLSKFARYEKKRKEMGQRKMSIWIYEQDADALKTYAKRKRVAFEKAQ